MLSESWFGFRGGLGGPEPVQAVTELSRLYAFRTFLKIHYMVTIGMGEP